MAEPTTTAIAPAVMLGSPAPSAVVAQTMADTGAIICSIAEPGPDQLALITRLDGAATHLLQEVPDEMEFTIHSWAAWPAVADRDDGEPEAYVRIVLDTDLGLLSTSSAGVRRSLARIIATIRPWRPVRVAVQRRRGRKPSPQLSLRFLGLA
jgi:hypothetical protein